MIYFDNAATSCPKPKTVRDEVYKYLSGYYCGNPGRGSHLVSLTAASAVYDCRCEIASFFGSDHPENVVFTYNASYALNIAIKGILDEGDHVIISNLEHNSVLRPVYALQKKMVSFDTFDALLDEEALLRDLKSKIRPNTKAVVCMHASNICSVLLPIRKIGELCKRYGLIFVVDASQSAGNVPINVEEDFIDILCAPGHKGLLGPQGSGFLLISPQLKPLHTLIEGGNGVNSLDFDMGTTLPEQLEAGTVSTPAIAGLCAGIRFLKSYTVQAVSEKERHLARYFTERIKKFDFIELYAEDFHQGSIVLFNVQGKSPGEISEYLSREKICVRSGYHCSPLGHRALNTPAGGALRASFGIYNTESEIDEFCRVLKRIMKY